MQFNSFKPEASLGFRSRPAFPPKGTMQEAMSKSKSARGQPLLLPFIF